MPCGFLCCKTVTSSPLHLLPSLIVQGFQTQSPLYAAYSHMMHVHIATFHTFVLLPNKNPTCPPTKHDTTRPKA